MNLQKYIGPIKNAKIVDNTGFETLTNDSAFIKRELVLVLEDGVKVGLENPDYMEFHNSPKGREKLKKSGLEKRHIDAIMLLWGNTATVQDNEDDYSE